MPIDIASYDPNWPAQFAQVREELRAVLRGVPFVAIEHIGSTSVPGLAAKPVIDVDVVVRRDRLPAAILAMEARGYRYRGDLGIADRYALAAPAWGVRRHVYLVVEGSLALRNHLAVRAALRADAAARDQYARIKRQLAARTGTLEAYVAGKTEFLLRVLMTQGFSADDLAEIGDANQHPSH